MCIYIYIYIYVQIYIYIYMYRPGPRSALSATSLVFVSITYYPLLPFVSNFPRFVTLCYAQSTY